MRRIRPPHERPGCLSAGSRSLASDIAALQAGGLLARLGFVLAARRELLHCCRALLQAAGADVGPGRLAVEEDANPLEVRVEAALRGHHRVAPVIAEARLLSADGADLGHRPRMVAKGWGQTPSGSDPLGSDPSSSTAPRRGAGRRR